MVFAKLTPGPGADGVESSSTRPRSGRNNIGDGTLTVQTVNIAGNRARSETWVAELTTDDTWRINSTLTQPVIDDEDPSADPYPSAHTGSSYTSVDGAIRFLIQEGSTPFSLGDTFVFATTGVTAPSQGVTVGSHRITAAPRAAITASPLSGAPPLEVTFDGRESRDPNGESLEYRWDFGDDSEFASGDVVRHTFVDAGLFTVTLHAKNTRNLLFDETSVDINVLNNRPQARITARPTSGAAPLAVQFDASGSSDFETPADELIYQWDFGDGLSANDGGVPGILKKTDHFYTTNGSGQECTRANPCTFSATLTVTDTGGKKDVALVTVLVGNTDPVVNITVTPDRGPTPLEVSFDTSGSSDADGDTLTIDWDWDGDGDFELEDKPVAGDDGSGVFKHTYTVKGVYVPAATIRDGKGGSTTWVSEPIRVTMNRSPNAVATVAPDSGIAGETEFTFDASRSTDPDSDLRDLTFAWDFDDDTAAGDGIRVTHTYVRPNLDGFNVTLTVTDGSGASHVDTLRVVVEPNPGNQSPVAHISTLPSSCTTPCRLTFDGTLTFDADDAFEDLEFRWEISTGGQVVDTLIGTPVTRDFTVPGTYAVELEVTDGRGGLDRDGPLTIIVTAPGQVPTDPPPGAGVPDGDDTTIPDSAQQRPDAGSFCGLGMVMSLFGSLVGLWAMAIVRRRWP